MKKMNNDTISREAAIAAADRADYPGLAIEDVKAVTDEVVKELKKLPPIQPQWIPVAERLPEKEGQYLVSGKWANEDGEVWICKFARLCHILGWCSDVRRPVVQAWMPLPRAYKKGKENE